MDLKISEPETQDLGTLYPASKSTSEVMLIALYDLGIHVAVLAHGAFPALLAVADGSSLA